MARYTRIGFGRLGKTYVMWEICEQVLPGGHFARMVISLLGGTLCPLISVRNYLRTRPRTCTKTARSHFRQHCLSHKTSRDFSGLHASKDSPADVSSLALWKCARAGRSQKSVGLACCVKKPFSILDRQVAPQPPISSVSRWFRTTIRLSCAAADGKSHHASRVSGTFDVLESCIQRI